MDQEETREVYSLSNRILLVARHSSIEPLGLHYLAGLAHSIGWDIRVFLTEDNAADLYRLVTDWKPVFAGFQVWTGYHLAAFEACGRAMERLRILNPSVMPWRSDAAQGYTNRNIAGLLQISIKGVEWHLHQSYRKLDVAGRAQLGPALLGAA